MLSEASPNDGADGSEAITSTASAISERHHLVDGARLPRALKRGLFLLMAAM